jgi:predicted permease
MKTLWLDLRYGFRLLGKYPRVTVWAVLSIALGVGANTAIFTLVHALLLKPLPVTEPARLIALWGSEEKSSGGSMSFFPISYPNFLDFREQNRSFSGLFAYRRHHLSFSQGKGDPELVVGQIVSTNYFDVLGVKPILGRGFTPGPDRAMGGEPTIVLSHGLWQSRLGGDPAVIGSTLTLDQRAFTVIGVAPPGFRGPQISPPSDFWVPMTMFKELSSRAALMDQRIWGLFSIMGRLKPGVTLAQARSDMAAISSRLRQTYPEDNEGAGVTLLPLTETMIDPNQRHLFTRSAGLLMAAVGVVLLIACANVGNLLLARTTNRRKEIAVRLAVGAGRGRLVRQLLLESAALALVGGTLGLLLALGGTRLLWSLRPPLLARSSVDLGLDPQVLAFTLGLAVLTSILCGLAPALQAAKTDLLSAIKSGGGLLERGHGGFSLRDFLVAAQVALALVALAGAGLLVSSLRHFQRVDPGFHAESLVSMGFDLQAQGYDEARGRELYRRLLERLASFPGVRSATLAHNELLSTPPDVDKVILEGEGVEQGRIVLFDAIGPHYFQTLGIPILRGRDFDASDRQDGRPVAVINQTMAESLWPGRDPVGQRFRLTSEEGFLAVIGVAGDSKYVSLGEPAQPYVYFPLEQRYRPIVTLYVDTAAQGGPASLLNPVRRAVQEQDRSLPLLDVSTVQSRIESSLWPQRMRATLLAGLGLLALVLAGVGIYAVTSYSVRQRRKEIALRVALGAQSGDVVQLILKRGMTVVGAGLVLGLAVVIGSTRLLAGVLFGVSATDPVALGGTVLLLAGVALLANYLPARRATRDDPKIALQGE